MRFLRVCLPLLLLSIPSALLADPILLADYDPQGLGVRRTCSGCTAPARVSFDIASVAAPSDPVYLFGNSGPDGFGFQIPIGTVGVFDFTGANAPGFNPLAARLTDSTNDNLIFMFTGITANDRAGEQAAFGGLLTGHAIDFFRLVVKENDVSYDPDGYTTTLSVHWQVWGDSSPAKVPVPGTLALVGVGISALAVVRRRTKTS